MTKRAQAALAAVFLTAPLLAAPALAQDAPAAPVPQIAAEAPAAAQPEALRHPHWKFRRPKRPLSRSPPLLRPRPVPKLRWRQSRCRPPNRSPGSRNWPKLPAKPLPRH